MKPNDRLRNSAGSLFLSAVMVALMFGGCKKKNPADPVPAPSSTRTLTPTLVFSSTLTHSPTVVYSSTPTNSPTLVYTDTMTYSLTGTMVPPTNTPVPSDTPTETLTSTPVPATFTMTPTSGTSYPAAVNLGTAGNFVILAKSGISTTGTTSVLGDLGVSPIDSTAITGFGLIMDASGTFSTSSLVTGSVYAADYTAPTGTMLTTAVSDMQTAFTDAAGRTVPPATTELGAGDISGMTLNPGLYKWGTGVGITTGVTLNCLGDANAVFIFQIAQDLIVANGTIVTLSGSCQARNIFWQVSGQATLGTTSDFKGVILSQTMVDMQTGAIFNGRALSQTNVTLDANPVTESN